jgi:ABC-type sugar transport system ATPase subunit
VGEFIGSPKMNVIEGALNVSGGTVSVDVLGVRADVTDRVAGRLADGVVTGLVLVGIRPHDLHLASGAANESPRIAARADVSEHTGTEVFANLDVGEVRVVARLPRAPIPEPGDRIELVFDRDSIHLFDPESKLSLLGRHRQRERVAATVESS